MKDVNGPNAATNKPSSCLKKFRDALELTPKPLYKRFATWRPLWPTTTKKSKSKKSEKDRLIANIRRQLERFDHVDPLEMQWGRSNRGKQFRAYVHACLYVRLWKAVREASPIYIETERLRFAAKCSHVEPQWDKTKSNKTESDKVERIRMETERLRIKDECDKNDALQKNIGEDFWKVISALKALQEEKKGFDIFPLKFILQRARERIQLGNKRVTDIIEISLFDIIKIYDDNKDFCPVLMRFLYSYCREGKITNFTAQVKGFGGDVVSLLEFMKANQEPLFEYIAETERKKLLKYFAQTETKAAPKDKEFDWVYMSVRNTDVDLLKEKKKPSKKEKDFLSELYLKDIRTNLYHVQQILSPRLFHNTPSIEPTRGVISQKLLHAMNKGVSKLIEDFFSLDDKVLPRHPAESLLFNVSPTPKNPFRE
jgi:hypothetical protein